MTLTCKIDGCDRLTCAKGLCERHYNNAHRAANLEECRAKEKDRRAKNRDRIRATHRTWRKAHPRRFAAYKAKWYSENVERESVRGHHYFICRHTRPSYVGLAFFDDWNPDRGGSFDAGAQWIITNLGCRPSNRHELHIVDRRLGFVPGNLAWVPQNRHRQEELINRLLLENQILRLENEQLRTAQ